MAIQWKREQIISQYIYGQLIQDKKKSRMYNWERKISLINGIRKTGQPHGKG